MPLVGMRRTTMVFGMVKSSEGARVLRSGRRLWLDSGDVNPKRPNNEGDEYYHSKNTPKSEVNKAAAEVNGKPKRLGHEENPKKQSMKMKAEAVNNGGKVDRMFGIVYTRKRKRNEVQKSQLSGNSEQKKFGKRFNRRQVSNRRRRARNPSLVGIHKANGALMSDLISSRRNGIPFSSVVSKNKLRSSVRNSSAAILSGMSSSISDLMQNVDSSQCSANILVIEPDRCYREGVIVTLELSASREWLLVVKKDRSTKYAHKPDKFMRPSSCNHFTHAIIWTGDDNWKLEFPNRLDWVIFKDLYKECSERNVPASSVKVIPVPGVCEVSGYEDRGSVPFCRPNSYISLDGDDVSRALAKRTANYDMDPEDEEWLKKFNNEFFSGNGHCEHLSEDCFELMFDAFEKAYFCSPDDFSNENAAHLSLDLGSRAVVEAVHAYWLRKRRQRRSALLRVFQGYQVKKAPLIPKPFLRKRRSFNRQASHGRGTQPTLLQALAAEHDALTEQNAMVKVEEATVSATRSVESAILRRQQAQLLMQNADMTAYKAMMALRIAEAAQFTESSDSAVAQFID